MNGRLVDTNVILDLFLNDPNWADWSEKTLNQYGALGELYINPIIYSDEFGEVIPAKPAILPRWLEQPHVLRPCFLMLFCRVR